MVKSMGFEGGVIEFFRFCFSVILVVLFFFGLVFYLENGIGLVFLLRASREVK